LLNVDITDDGAMEIARRSRGTPRIANRQFAAPASVILLRSQGDGKIG
jgi:Holliday junction resolvasome RuvABC ATP-dependent DNA helicase subunit